MTDPLEPFVGRGYVVENGFCRDSETLFRRSGHESMISLWAAKVSSDGKLGNVIAAIGHWRFVMRENIEVFET